MKFVILQAFYTYNMKPLKGCTIIDEPRLLRK